MEKSSLTRSNKLEGYFLEMGFEAAEFITRHKLLLQDGESVTVSFKITVNDGSANSMVSTRAVLFQELTAADWRTVKNIISDNAYFVCLMEVMNKAQEQRTGLMPFREIREMFKAARPLNRLSISYFEFINKRFKKKQLPYLIIREGKHSKSDNLVIRLVKLIQ